MDVLFCSSAVLDPRVGHATQVHVLSPFFSVILTDSFTESPVHVLMLSIQAVRGLPRLRAPGIVPCNECKLKLNASSAATDEPREHAISV